MLRRTHRSSEDEARKFDLIPNEHLGRRRYTLKNSHELCEKSSRAGAHVLMMV